MKYEAPRGMEDNFALDIHIWHFLEETARKELESYGYSEIRTPVLEDTAIFTRSIGESSDIVTKEMFTFKDRKARSLTLRPEGTAPIVRSYVEHSLDKILPETKLYYIGPMFRSERPQKGRLRQFHQIGAEIIGSNSYFADAELIHEMDRMLRLFGLGDFKIRLNTLGCTNDKDEFTSDLRKYLKDKEKLLCEDCRIRLKKNVLRVLDCKNETCMQIVRHAPNMLDNLCPGCKEHFEKLKEVLTATNVEFEEAKNLARGLDYYTGTVFEVTHPALGGQDAIGAGGRYDNLVKDFGGPNVGAVGYALGMERIILAFKEKPSKISNVVFIATLGEEAKIRGIQIAEKLRDDEKLRGLEGFAALTDINNASLKSQMRTADSSKAKLVIILGEDELKASKAAIRDMAKKEQVSVALDEIVDEVKKKIGV